MNGSHGESRRRGIVARESGVPGAGGFAPPAPGTPGRSGCSGSFPPDCFLYQPTDTAKTCIAVWLISAAPTSGSVRYLIVLPGVSGTVTV